jgi:hypothetical protein
MDITIGDGKKPDFGRTIGFKAKPPRGIAQLLYNLAHFKNIKVEKELHNSNWIQGVRRISTREELSQFVDLWSMLKNVALNPETRDEIK